MKNEKITTNLEKSIKKAIHQAAAALGFEIELSDIGLEHPSDEEYGDYASNIALAIFSESKKQNEKSKIAIQNSKFANPLELAKTIKQKLASNISISQYLNYCNAVAPGFLNISIKNEWLIREIERALSEKDKYGKTEWHKGETWLLEHTSPNPNKAMHLGHLRNNITGMAIANIWEFLGIKVIRDCIDNNRGIAIAKLMWGYLKFGRLDKKETTDLSYWRKHQDEWQTPEEAKIRPDRFVDEFYIKASQDCKVNKKTEKRVRQLVLDWENEDKNTWELWKKVLDYSYKGQQLTLKRLGNKWDQVWHEHEHYKQGKDLVNKGLKIGVFKKLEDGAILSGLESYGLTDTILIKSDGSALYITQDLALTKLKREKFKPDKLFWVIGPEQSLALKQLFAICEQLGTGKVEDYTHIPYGYMSIKGIGKMSSRAGNVVYIDDLIDKGKEKILKKIDKSRFSGKEMSELAEKIAIGAVKYSILKVGRMSNISFDFDESLAFEGNSGPYLQYTYARCQSVLAKFQKTQKDQKHQKSRRIGVSENHNFPSLLSLLNSEELAVLRWLYRFPEVVLQAGREYAPNLICNYLYELSQRFNGFYNKHNILRPQNETIRYTLYAIRQFRLALTAATAQILKNGLTLLGIEAIERM